MLQLIELFAGIGSQKKALDKAKIKHKVINICEWDIDAIISYAAIHHKIKDDTSLDKKIVYNYLKKFTFSSDGKKPYNNIEKLDFNKARLLYIACIKTNNLVSIIDAKGADINIDPSKDSLITYSFPCQDLSNQGKQRGLYEGGASSMLWQVQRLLEELKELGKLPKNLLMENVPAIVGPKHSDGFNSWKEFLTTLGYKNNTFNLRASNFGLPQNRDRTFMFSSLNHNNKALTIETNKLVNDNHEVLKDWLDNNKDVEEKWFKESYTALLPKELVYKEIKATKKGIMKVKLPELSTFSSEACCYAIDGVGPTLTANGAQSRIKLLYPDKTIRLMNSKEALRYMGFEDKDYELVKSVGMKDTKIIKQSGNSIPVTVLKYIFELGVK